MSVHFQDLFTDVSGTGLVSHTADSGHTWAESVGWTGRPEPTISNANRLKSAGTGATGQDAILQISLTAPADDLIIPVTWKVQSNGQYMAVAFDISQSVEANFYKVNPHPDGHWYADKYASGFSAVSPGAGVASGLSVGDVFNGYVKVTHGSSTVIEVYDSADVLKATFNDSSPLAATRRFGVYSSGLASSDSTGFQLDAMGLVDSPVDWFGPPAATSYTNTPPSPAKVKEGTASSPLTLVANGATTAIVTPVLDELGATFTPATETLNGTTNVTYTVTPALTGVARTVHVSVTNDGGLTNPASVALEVWIQQVVVVTPTGPNNLSNGQTLLFSAAVTGGPSGESPAGTWSVTGGGSITTGGSFTAPSTGTGTATIRFTHTASGAFGEQTADYAPGVLVTNTPTPVTVAQGATQQFTATVTGDPDTSVVWSITEGPTAGTITTGGLLTAGSTPGVYHVVATSVADPTKSATATVTVPAIVTAAPSKMQGYALNGPVSGEPVFVRKNSAGQFWNGATYEDLDTTNLAAYQILATNTIGCEWEAPYPPVTGICKWLLIDKQALSGGALVASDFAAEHILDGDTVVLLNGQELADDVAAAVLYGQTVKISANVYEYKLGGISKVRITYDPVTLERTLVEIL